MCEVIGSVKKQFLGESIRYSMDWRDRVKPEVGAYPAIAVDKITSSTWTLDSDSPATAIDIVASGYNDQLHVTWVTIKAAPALADGDVIYLTNTIETSGIQPMGQLTEPTSGQVLKRQYRIRFAEC